MKRPVSNLLALAVLSYLSRAPMHPYELGRTLREHGDARSIKFNHGSLYMVFQQLEKAGFVAARETSREGQRPERTVYAITDAGRREQRELVEEARHEYPHFVAALSLIAALPRTARVIRDATLPVLLWLTAESKVQREIGEHHISWEAAA